MSKWQTQLQRFGELEVRIMGVNVPASIRSMVDAKNLARRNGVVVRAATRARIAPTSATVETQTQSDEQLMRMARLRELCAL
jgi:hypothetical protein